MSSLAAVSVLPGSALRPGASSRAAEVHRTDIIRLEATGSALARTLSELDADLTGSELIGLILPTRAHGQSAFSRTCSRRTELVPGENSAAKSSPLIVVSPWARLLRNLDAGLAQDSLQRTVGRVQLEMDLTALQPDASVLGLRGKNRAARDAYPLDGLPVRTEVEIYPVSPQSTAHLPAFLTCIRHSPGT